MEKVLITYYSSKVEDSLFLLKINCEELALRYNLILKAFEQHKEERYYAKCASIFNNYRWSCK